MTHWTSPTNGNPRTSPQPADITAPGEPPPPATPGPGLDSWKWVLEPNKINPFLGAAVLLRQEFPSVERPPTIPTGTHTANVHEACDNIRSSLRQLGEAVRSGQGDADEVEDLARELHSMTGLALLEIDLRRAALPGGELESLLAELGIPLSRDATAQPPHELVGKDNQGVTQ